MIKLVSDDYVFLFIWLLNKLTANMRHRKIIKRNQYSSIENDYLNLSFNINNYLQLVSRLFITPLSLKN